MIVKSLSWACWGCATINRLSEIIKQFNGLFGGIGRADEDGVRKTITGTVHAIVAEDIAFKNARSGAWGGWGVGPRMNCQRSNRTIPGADAQTTPL